MTADENAFVEVGSEFAPPPSAVAPRDPVEPPVEEEDDTSYKELQARAKELDVPANLPKDALIAAIAEEERKLAEAAARVALEEQYGPFIANLWQGTYPNFGCPAAGCSFLTLGTDREDGERQIAEHFSASHVPAAPESVQSALLGPDGLPIITTR